MRVDRINYQKTFNLGNYTSERIGLEAELEAGDDGEAELKKLKKAVEDLHKATNPGLYVEINQEALGTFHLNGDPYHHPTPNGRPTPPPVIDRKAIERMEILIDDCNTMDELVKYKDQVGPLGLIDMYHAKFDQLMRKDAEDKLIQKQSMG